MAGALKPGWSVRRKSVYCSNGFAYLTAALGDEWSHNEPLPDGTFGTALRVTIPVRVSIHDPKTVYDGTNADAVTSVIHRCDR